MIFFALMPGSGTPFFRHCLCFQRFSSLLRRLSDQNGGKVVGCALCFKVSARADFTAAAKADYKVIEKWVLGLDISQT